MEENRASKYTSYCTNREICKNVSKKQKEIAQTEQKYVWMKSLSDTASGMLNGKAKIELETYVQMAYFMKENGNYTKSFQEYILVKENGKWKILSFQKNVSKDESKTEEQKG